MGLVQLPNVRKHFEKTAFWINKVAITFISRNMFDHVLQSMKGNVDDMCRIFIPNVPIGMRKAILRFAVINAYHMYELYHGKKL